MDKAAEIAIQAAPYFHANLVAAEMEEATKQVDHDETILRGGPGEKPH